MKRHTSRTVLLGLLATCAIFCFGGAALAADARLNLQAWQQLPVMHHGRVMPLQSYARSAAEIICGKENPRFNITHEVAAEDLASDEFAAVRMLFPEDKHQKRERKFEASELLLSWIAEPAAWDRVPFILAEHEHLRTLLGLELVNADKERLRYVSPYDLAESEAFMTYLHELQTKDKQARMDGREFKAEGLDKLVADLWSSFKLFRQLTTDPVANERARSRFMDKASATLKDWATLSEPTNLGMLRGGDAATDELGKLMGQLDAAQEAIVKSAGDGEFAIAEIEPAVNQFVTSAVGLHENLSGLKQKMFEDRSRVLNDEQRAFGKELLTRVTSRSKIMARNALEMHLALYDDGESLRVVPALNASALEKDRDVMVDSQPWLSLRTVLQGSPLVLAPYPTAAITHVRTAYDEMVAAYTNRDNSDRAGAFERTAEEFAASMRSLGEQIEPLRQRLPVEQVDADLMAHTRYPAASVTAVEVRYNNLDPFTWSWVLSLLAVMAFCVSFGVVRKPMFWTAMALLALCIAWTIYGFYLRVLITRWAPVTNMYETVIYVPLFVSALGVWFVLTPLIWNGLRAAWRATAIPFAWEATPLSDDEQRMMSESSWQTVNLAMLLPRVALMGGVFWLLTQATYYDGGNTVLSLSPKVPLNQLALDFNALTVWLISVLVVAVSVWYLPRVLMTVIGSIVMIPWSLAGRTADAAEGVYQRWPFGLSAASVALLGYLVASYAPLPGESISPLQPVLRSNFWLTIHVLTIVSSYAAGALAWMIGNIALAYYAFGKYREPAISAPLPGHAPITLEVTAGPRMVARRAPEQTVALASYAYKAMQVAVMLLAAGTILGGLWADVSWGRFWGWDPKEVFALVSLLIYLAMLHGRFAGWFGNFALAVGTVFGATAIIFSWYGVNFVLGVGLHSYGFGTGGQLEVGTAVAANWLFMGFAGWRYWYETRPVPAPHPLPAGASSAALEEPVGSAQ